MATVAVFESPVPSLMRYVNGGVPVDGGPGRRVNYAVSSVTGATRSTLDPVEGAGPDGGVMAIHVRTVSGDVRIGRAGLPV